MREAGTDETGEMEEGPAAASDREWGVAESEEEGGAAESWEIRVKEMIFWRERVVFIARNFFFFFNNIRYGSGSGRAGSGFYKNPYPTRTRFRFFLKNPNPTLFLIGSGKIRPIRVGPDRVPADRVKIAIPN